MRNCDCILMFISTHHVIVPTSCLLMSWWTWWRHQMETFSALLAICAGNSPVPGEFPTQRPVARSFGVFFDLHPNKRLSKHSWGWWFETPSCPLWRHRNVRHSGFVEVRQRRWTNCNVNNLTIFVTNLYRQGRYNNSTWLIDAVWLCRSWSALVKSMASRVTASSHNTQMAHKVCFTMTHYPPICQPNLSIHSVWPFMKNERFL